MEKNQGTEPPSQRKLRKARERGEVAYSRDLTSAAAMLGALAGMAGWLPGAFGSWMDWLRGCLAGEVVRPLDGGFRLLLSGVASIGGCAAAAALLAGLLQTRFRFGWRMRWDAIRPLRGVARLLSRERVADLLLSVAKIAMVLAAGAALIVPAALGLCAKAGGDMPNPDAALSSWALVLAPLAGLSMAFALFDLYWQRRRFLRRMRMTRQEVRQEHREEEGDPHLRSERRRRHQALLSGGLESLKRAAVVVANPTHLAVALRYRPEEDDAPVVACSGRDGAALRIRREAARLHVPVVENVPLARSLIRVAPGEEIPEALYPAVAEVLRSLEEFSAGGPAGARSRCGTA
jgi:flagellar biosynthesis protein FlhB